MSGRPRSREHIRFFLVLLFFWGSLFLFVPILAPFAQLRGASLQTVGLIGAAYGFSQLVLRIPCGILSDRLRARRPFITAGFIASMLGSLGLVLVENPTAMIFFRGLTGVAASMWLMFTVLYAALFPPHQTARAMGYALTGVHLTLLTSTLVGGLIAEQFGWTTPFYLGSALAAVGVLLSFTLRDDAAKASGSAPSARELFQVMKNPHLLLVSGLGALSQCSPYMTLWTFSTVLAAQLGATRAELGLLTFAGILPTAVGSFVSGNWLERLLGPRRTVILGFCLCTGACLLYVSVNSLVSLAAVQMVNSLGFGFAMAMLMTLSIRRVPSERRATAMGVFQSSYALGMFGAPALGGFLGQTFGLRTVFLGAAVLVGIGALLSVFGLREEEEALDRPGQRSPLEERTAGSAPTGVTLPQAEEHHGQNQSQGV